jgi:hypothetical protein
MWFLYPVFLAGAAAIALPIALHLLRREVAPAVPFSAVRLLRRTPLEETRRRHLRELWLLAARIAALLLLAAAFARPYFTAGAVPSRVHVVAIDRSYSMGAPGRFERALELARAAVRSSGRSDRVAVVAFDDRADVLAPPGPPGAAAAALDGLRPGSGGTRYAPAVRQALELGDQGSIRLSVISDFQRAGWAGADPSIVPADMQVDLHDAGPPIPNAAVVEIRPAPAAVIATIRNDGPETASGSARVLLDGRAVASSGFSVAPETTTNVAIAYRVPESGGLAVEIDDPRGYAADNRRYLLLGAGGRTRVLVVAADEEQSGFYVTRALQAATGDDALEVRTIAGSALGRADADRLAEPDAVVLLSTRSLDRRARELLPAMARRGAGLLVAAGADVDPALLATMMGWPAFSASEQAADTVTLAATDVRHPILQPFGALAANLGQVRFRRVWRVRGEGWDVIARFTDGTPALLERGQGAGRVVLFASDLGRRWNDFPLAAAFVPFTLESVRHVAASTHARQAYLVSGAPAESLGRPGIHTRASDGQPFAVNVDPLEGAGARLSEEEFRAMLRPEAPRADVPVAGRAQQAEGRQNLWRYGVWLMLAALVAESVLGRPK